MHLDFDLGSLKNINLGSYWGVNEVNTHAALKSVIR